MRKLKNATLLLSFLSLAWAGTAAAQTDDTDEEEAPAAEAPPAAESPAEGEAPAAAEEPDELDTPPETELEEGDVEDEAEESEEAEEAAAEEEEAPAAEPLPWRNSFFDWVHTATFNTFARDAQLAYDPFYYQSFSLTPRWYVGPQSFFWASAALGVEVTDGNGYALQRDPQLSDVLVDYRQIINWEGFIFMPSVRIGVPVSKASQAAQRYLQTGLGLTVTRPIPEAFLTVSGTFSYRHWWAGSNVARTGQPMPSYCPGPQSPTSGAPEEGGGVFCDQAGIVTTGREILVSGATVTFSYEWFSLAGQFLFVNQYAHELAAASIDVATSEEPLVLQDTSRTHWRNYTYFTLAASFQALPWLSVTLGFQNTNSLAPAYNADGSVRSIFTPDSSAYLDFTVQLDELWGEVSGGGEEELTPEQRQRRRQGLARTQPAGGSF